MNEFEFSLGQQVKIVCSGERGQVIGRAEYSRAGNNYYVEYRAADGRAVQSWWDAGALEAANPAI